MLRNCKLADEGRRVTDMVVVKRTGLASSEDGQESCTDNCG